MNANASRLRKPVWNRRRHEGTETTAPKAVPSSALAYGTALAYAEVGARTIWCLHARTGIWCRDATGADVSVISWGDNRTPSLQLDPADPLAHCPHGAEAELLVRSGMAAWRHLFEDAGIEPALQVTVNSDLDRHTAVHRREDADARR